MWLSFRNLANEYFTMPESITAAITGVAAWTPDTRLTNKDLEQMVDTNDEWIRERTGISSRPILKMPGKGSSYLGIRALKKLIKKTDLDVDSIDLLICSTVVPDYKYPPTSSLIMESCGVKNAYGFDLNGTCSGFLYALDVANAFIRSGKYKKIVVVSAEKLSSMANYKDRASCILFGDGGSAVLLEPSSNDYGIVDTEMKAMTKGAMNITFLGGGSVNPATEQTVRDELHFFKQDGRAVFKQAVMGMETVSRTVMDRNGISADDIKWVVPHQANKRIIDTIASRMGVEDKMFVNIENMGNMSTVTIPLCLEKLEPSLEAGDKLILTAFGSGYTMGAVYLQWAY